jgi:histidinol-phosphate phosphatase family protein
MNQRPPTPLFDLVVPTVGRDSLGRLLAALAAATGPLPGQVLVVDDRGADRSAPLLASGPPPRLADRLRVVRGRAAGPAAARNLGWRRAAAPWVGFLDDDVEPGPTWLADLEADLAGLPPGVAGSQGRLRVPLPAGRRPTDWERNVQGLENARWATADMAYRWAVLAEVGGFDERFRRAYREDADLALRVVGAGYRIARGRRQTTHPVRRADRLASVRLQAGNADDVLMAALHGRGWRQAAGVQRGRRSRHLATTAAGLATLGALAVRGAGGRDAASRGVNGIGAGRRTRNGRRRWSTPVAVLTGAGWLAGTAELAWARIAPGPRTPAEVATMAATSLLLPPAATWHWLAGWWRRRGLLADTARAPRPAPSAVPTTPPAVPPGHPAGVPRTPPADPPGHPAGVPRTPPADPPGHPPGVPRTPPAAVLFDRDGTLVADVPYNGDPELVVAMPGARAAVARLRAAGVAIAVVTNQSGVARGRLRSDQVEAVNRRVEELLGPLGPWLVCRHGPEDGCRCRKPAPGLVEAAARALGVAPRDCVVIGDIGADVEAASAAGARSVLVPTAATRAEEVAVAPEVAPDLGAAVDLLLGPTRPAGVATAAGRTP